jgi:hypothetical protein
VEDCSIHDNGGDGIDLNSRAQAGAAGVIVRRNRVVRNHLNGIKLWAGGRIENNLVWGQGNSGVWAGTFPGALEIFNNTIAYNMWDPSSERNWSLVVGYPEEMDAPPVSLTLRATLRLQRRSLRWGDRIYRLGSGYLRGINSSSAGGGRDHRRVRQRHDPDFTRLEIANGVWSRFSGQG